MSLEANQHMCRYCFDVLTTKLQHGHSKSMPDFDGVDTSIHCPLFVTLHIVQDGGQYMLLSPSPPPSSSSSSSSNEIFA